MGLKYVRNDAPIYENKGIPPSIIHLEINVLYDTFVQIPRKWICK